MITRNFSALKKLQIYVFNIDLKFTIEQVRKIKFSYYTL